MRTSQFSEEQIIGFLRPAEIDLMTDRIRLSLGQTLKPLL